MRQSRGTGNDWGIQTGEGGANVSRYCSPVLLWRNNRIGRTMSTSNFTSLCTIQELAAILRCPVGTIYYWISRNEIPFIKLGRHLRFIPEDVLIHFKQVTDDK